MKKGKQFLYGGLALWLAVMVWGVLPTEQAHAQAPIIIDDWETPQAPISLTVPGVMSTTVTSTTHILGGARDFVISLTNAGLISASVQADDLWYTQSPTTVNAAVGMAVWDGADGDAVAIDYTGLNGLDLTDTGQQNAFLLQLAHDANATVTVAVYSDTNASAYTLTLSAGSFTNLMPRSYLIHFTDFVTLSGTGADFSDVGAIALRMTGTNGALNLLVSDFRTTFVSPLRISKSAAPDPATAGEWLTYTIVIINTDTVSVTNVTLSDTLSLSTTLQPVDQTDADNTHLGFGGGQHQNTGWYDPRPRNPNSNKWLEMETHLGGTGVYTSRVMDATNAGPWTELVWEPRRPYWKPLPDNAGEEVNYPVGRVDMFGNRVLLHMDAISTTAFTTDSNPLPKTGILTNTSGITISVTYPADPSSEHCPTIETAGRFNQALRFNAPGRTTVMISDSVASDSYALEMWVRPEVVTDTALILRANLSGTHPISGQQVRISHLLGIYNGKFIHAMTDEAGHKTVLSNSREVLTNTWYHVVGTGRAGGTLRLYVNGEEAESAGTIGTPWQGGDHYRLGTDYGLTLTLGISGTAQYYTGALDELAVYTRTLSPAEVRDHYLRGALRLSFEVRSCDDAVCAGEVFTGTDGFTYSEQMNTTLGQPTLALDNVLDNRYFQYRVTLESDADSNSPELRLVRVEPEDRAGIGTSQGACTGASGDTSFTCALGSLAGRETITIVTQLDLDPSARGVITNTASVTATTAEGVTATNSTVVTTTIVGRAALDVRKYDNRTYVNLGDVITYRIEVQNIGPSTAYSVTITDTLPLTLTGYPTGRNGWTCGDPGNIITCTIPSLAVTGDQYSWRRAATITMTAPFTQSLITNMVWITSALTPISTTTVITDDDTTEVTILADIEVDKWASTNLITPSATLTYTVIVTNTGPEAAHNVWVTDTLPLGLTGYPVYDPGVWAACSAPGPVVGCVLSGTLAVTQSARFEITVTAPMSGFLANSVAAVADEQDDNPGNNEVTLYTAVLPVADLAISKSATPDPVAATAPLTYTFVATNTGPVAAGQYETTQAFDNETDINISAPNAHSWNYPSPINLSSIVGVIRNVTVTLYQLDHTFPADLSVLLVGPGDQKVLLMEGAGGGISADNVTLIFNQAATQTLPLSGTLDSPAPYQPTAYDIGYADLPSPAPSRSYGSSLNIFNETSPNGSWQLYVADNVPHSDGGGIAGWRLELTTFTDDEVIVMDNLPTTLNGPVTVTAPAGWTCDTPTSQIMCRADYFGVGDTATFVVNAFAPADGGIITNTATVSATTTDLLWDDNTATITTTVTPVVDLAIIKSAIPMTVSMGYPLTYTLAISNIGPSAALTTVTVVDTLPGGLTHTVVTAVSWGCDTSALPVFTCTLDSLLVGAAPMITITADAPMALGAIDNSADVSSAADDPDMANNNDTVTVSVIDRPILALEAYNDSPTLLGDQTTLWAVATPADGVSYTWLVSGTVHNGITVTVAYSAAGTFTALVTATNAVSVLTATTPVTIITTAADLTVFKSVRPTTATLGQPLTYTLVISNAGPNDVPTPITLTDNLPANVSNIAVTAGVATTCDTMALPSVVTCTLTSLMVYSETTVLTVTANAPSVRGSFIVNSATVDAAIFDPQTANNTTVLTTTVLDVPVSGLLAFNDSPTLLGYETAFSVTVTSGTNVSYTWNFGNGDTAAGMSPTHTYSVTGTYTAIVTATNMAGSAAAVTATTTVTVVAIPEVAFSMAAYSITEGLTATITATLQSPAPVTVTVDYVTGDGTATAGADYTAAAGPLAFAPGVTARAFTVATFADALNELDETVVLTLSNPGPVAVLGVPSVVTLTIMDDDPTPTLSVNDVVTGEGAGGLTFTVSLSAVSALDVAVDYATSDNMATAGADYVAAAGRVTIVAGSTLAWLPVSVLDDAIDEADETFSMTLAHPVNADLADAAGIGTIVDDDTVGVTLAPRALVVAEGGITATYQVVLESAPTDVVTVAIVPDAQLAPTPARVLFTNINWSTPQTVTVAAVDDVVVESITHAGRLTNTTVSSDANYAGTFVITVTAIITDNDNTAPVAGDDVYTTTEDVVLVVPAPGVLGNDVDAELDLLTATLVTLPATGSFTFAADGSFVYTPTLEFNGGVTFTYYASDGYVDSNVATVTLTVMLVNDAPVAVSDVYTTAEDVVLRVAAPGVLGNDSDVDSAVLTATLGAAPAHGGVALAADGGFVYTPTLNFYGGDAFTYLVTDGVSPSRAVTVTLNVLPVNDVPLVGDDVYTTTEDVVLTVAAPGVLGNDSDVESSVLTATLVTGPTSGILALAGDGGLVYTPTQDFSGWATFTYQATDADLAAMAVMTIVVVPQNDPPVALSDVYTTAEDVVLSVAAPGVLGNDSDVDSAVLTATLDTVPLSGTLLLAGDGGFVYTPTLNFYGGDTFQYHVTDGASDSARVTVTLGVLAVNDAPVARADAYTTTQNVPLVVAAAEVLANAGDVEGDALTLVLDSGPTQGTLSLAADGGFVYTPTRDYVGGDSFTYHLNDGLLDSALVMVTLTVDPPLIQSIYLPLVMHNFAHGPDLVVEQIIAASDLVVVVIRNQGDRPVVADVDNEFWVDLYIDPHTPPTAVNQTWDHAGDAGAAWGVTISALPLEPGDVLTLTIGSSGGPYPYYYADKSEVTWPLAVGTEIWTQVDSANEGTDYGAVLENHEFVGASYNNITGPVNVTGLRHALESGLPSGPMPPESEHLPVRPEW